MKFALRLTHEVSKHFRKWVILVEMVNALGTFLLCSLVVVEAGFRKNHDDGTSKSIPKTSSNRSRRQASFLCTGNRFATTTLNQALTLSRESIKRAEPLLVGTYKLGVADLKDGRVSNAYTTIVLNEAKVQCINRTIYLWVPIFVTGPRALFDLAFLSNIDAGEFVLSFDQLFANITLAIPKPPKQRGAKSKVLKFQILGSPGIAVRSPTRGPLSAAFSTALNILLRTFKYPAERLVEIVIEDLLKRYLENNDLPL